MVRELIGRIYDSHGLLFIAMRASDSYVLK